MSQLTNNDFLNNSPATVLAELKKLLNDPVLRSLHTSKPKPAGYAKRSNTPYYKPRFGFEVKAIYDTMMETGESQCIAYADYPELNINTIYARINQGRFYLLDHLDPEGKYKVFDEYVKIERPRRKGITFTLVTEGSKQLVARKIQDPANMDAWKHSLENFIENASEGETWKKDGLFLLPEEINILQATLAPIVNIVANITPSSIVLRKISVSTEPSSGTQHNIILEDED